MKEIIYRVYYPACSGMGVVYEDFNDEAAAEDFLIQFNTDEAWMRKIGDDSDMIAIQRAGYNPAISQIRGMKVVINHEVIGIAFPYYEKKRAEGGIVPFVNAYRGNCHAFGAYLSIRPNIADNAAAFAYDFIKNFLGYENISLDDIDDIEYEFK